MTIRDFDKTPPDQLLIFDENSFSTGTKQLLSESLHYDFEFFVENETIPTHKAILAARSDFFEQIFSSKDAEKICEIANVENVSKKAFKKFLLYLYTEELESPRAFVSDFLELARKFKIMDLKEKCEEILAKQLSDTTAGDIFQKVHRYGLNDDLKLNSFKLIKKWVEIAVN